MSDELLNLAKEGERLRKLVSMPGQLGFSTPGLAGALGRRLTRRVFQCLQHKETGLRFERQVQESELLMEKAKARFDATAEELERILIAKEGENAKDAGA